MRLNSIHGRLGKAFSVTLIVLFAGLGDAQSSAGRVKLPPVKGLTEPAEPEHPLPAAQDVHDAKYKLSWHVPAGWNFDRQDGALSDFHKDVRSAPQRSEVRGVASINFNPYPASTFSGATLYYSVLPVTSAAGCAAEAATKPVKPMGDAVFAGKTFKHGQDQHGAICTESRDEVYTVLQGRSCLRFDMVINTFCHASSGAMEISPTQLKDLNQRMAKMLDSIRLD